MSKKIELKIDQDNKLAINNGVITFDNDFISLASKIEDTKIVKYLTWNELQCDKWSVALNQEASEHLANLGIDVITFKDSPMITST